MDFTVSKRAKEVALRVRAFVEKELHPHELNYPNSFHLEPERVGPLRAKAKEQGLWALHMPEEVGGGGLSYLEMCTVFEEMAQTTVGQEVFGSHAPDAPTMVLLNAVASPEQKKRYLQGLMDARLSSCIAMTEPGAPGSDPRAITTRAEKKGSGWVIDGHKWLIGNGMTCDFYVLITKTDDDEITAFLVDRETPGVRPVRWVEDMHATAAEAEVSFEGVEVPDEAMLGERGQGFDAAQERLAFARIAHAMRFVGMAMRCQSIAIAHAADRSRLSFGKPLGAHGQVQAMIADNAVDIHASRLITMNCAWNADRGVDIRYLASITKLHSSEMLCRVADRALQVLGGKGFTRDLPVEKIYRTARAGRIYDGPSEIHRFVIARQLLRGFATSDIGLALES